MAAVGRHDHRLPLPCGMVPHLQVWHLSSSGHHSTGAFCTKGKLWDILVAGKGPLATCSEGLAAAIHAGVMDLDNNLHSSMAEP